MRGADPRVALGLHRSRHERGILEAALEVGVRALDTSSNYFGFTSHRSLAVVASDLLPEFEISTKVGFFPVSSLSAAHHLTPELVRYGVELAVDDLGVAPSVVLLHNPERSLVDLPPIEAYHRLSAACEVLEAAKAAGLCRQWGISSWNPGPLLDAFGEIDVAVFPRPDVVMVRAGLLVGSDVLDRAEVLLDVLNVPLVGRWGMSPFGGNTREPIWDDVDARMFLADEQLCSRPQAAFRLAFELPAVQRVAVGTDNPVHLRDLVMATTLAVNRERLSTYRLLLRQRQAEGRESAIQIG